MTFQRDLNNQSTSSRIVLRQNIPMRGMTMSMYDKSPGLIEAVNKNDITKVIECVKNGCTLQSDKEGKSPIHIAAENGYIDILKYLLQAFPMYNVNTPDQTGNTALHKAANIGHMEMIKALLERGAQVNLQDLIGLFTPLHLAVQSGHNQTTRNLIKCGADITAKNKFGDTPLHTAVRYGHAGVSRIIISVSTNVNYQNQNGDAPLHIAAALKRRKIVKLLIEAGAFLDIRNYQNESPIDVAVKKNHKEILEIFSMARNANINSKTVSFTPDAFKESYAVQSRHVSIPNETSPEMHQTSSRPSRAKSQSPHEKIKSKKSNIVKGFFSRKKKDKGDKRSEKPAEEKHSFNPPLTPNKSILSCSKRQKGDQWIQNSESNLNSSFSISQVPGLINTYQPQLGSLFFKDLAGNIKHGPIGYAPMAFAPSTCNCTQFSQSSIKNKCNSHIQSNVCLDHGYKDYHGPMSQCQEDRPYAIMKSKEKIEKSGFPLTKAKSDESLNQSEHKSRMQEERLKDAKTSQMCTSPVKGRRKNMVNQNWNSRQNSLIKDFQRDQNLSRISIQISQKSREPKEGSVTNLRQYDSMRTVMRPSPDGQTDLGSTPSYDHPKFRVDWRAGKYRPDKVILPSSKV